MYFSFKNNTFCNNNIESLKIAVSGTDRDINWETLELEVKKYIEIFEELDMKKGHPVIIYGDKEASFLVAMLALIKMEIPYVPFDKSYPNEWLRKVKIETNSDVIINSGNYRIDTVFPIVINSDLTYSINCGERYNTNANESRIDPIIYIMFTSGSTGDPKFIQISKSSIISFLSWIKTDHLFSSKNIYMNHASLSFDLSVYSIYSTFAFGGTIVMVNDAIYKKHDKFFKKLLYYKVNTWISTPSFAYTFVINKEFSSENIIYLKSFIFIGESLRKNLVSKIWEQFDKIEIINSYGPTEATVATMFSYCNKNMLKDDNEMPIGMDKVNGEVLLFHKGKPAQKGEIIIIGDQVSLGYLNKNSNNDVFFRFKNKRAFRTGDYGFIKNGKFYFSGRRDNQIKYNGYRIELENITKTLIKIDHIRDSITIAFRRNDIVKKIVSFVTLEENLNISNKTLFKMVTNILPKYMVPSNIIIVDQFPLNKNNKVDKKMLQEMYLNNEI